MKLYKSDLCDTCDNSGECCPAPYENKFMPGCPDYIFRSTKDQNAKADAGKPEVRFVPSEIIRDIAYIRSYGNAKYGDPDSWKNVETERYIDALYRHVLSFIEDPYGLDEESGMPSLWHIACNVAFLCEKMKGQYKNE